MPETQAIAGAIRQEITLSGTAPPLTERTPFAGRVSEWTLLLEAIESTIAGQGGLIAIEGEAGMGKSRLLREIMAGARWWGAVVVADGPDFPPAQARLLFQQALTELLQTLASLKPHVMLFDDLHWADPLFVNPAANDYHIQAGSPAINAGTNAGIADDIDGDARPQDGGFDIGADEYVQAAPPPEAQQKVYLPILLKN